MAITVFLIFFTSQEISNFEVELIYIFVICRTKSKNKNNRLNYHGPQQ